MKEIFTQKMTLAQWIIAAIIIYASVFGIPIPDYFKSAPSCDEASVKSLVIDISLQELKNYQAPRTAAEYILASNEHFSKSNLTEECKKIRGELFMLSLGQDQYDRLNKLKDNFKSCDEKNVLGEAITTQIDQPLSKLKIKDIRTDGKDNSIKKSECSASIALSNGNAIPITYSAQLTSEGKLYTEILGLPK